MDVTITPKGAGKNTRMKEAVLAMLKIGNRVIVRWKDGTETKHRMIGEFLRVYRVKKGAER